MERLDCLGVRLGWHEMTMQIIDTGINDMHR